MKYRCSLNYFTEEIIEADDKEEAEEEFWKRNDLLDIEAFLEIKQYRKKRKQRVQKR